MVINNSTTDAVVEAPVAARALNNIDADDDVGCAPTEIDSESSVSDLDDATQGELQAKHRRFSVECTTIDSDSDDANKGESEVKHRKFSVDGTERSVSGRA